MSENHETTEVTTRQITIQGQSFIVPAPYEAGHVLTEVEAGVLNQTYAENLRNNFAAQIKKALETIEDLKAMNQDYSAIVVPGQAELTEYAKNYSFGVRPASASQPADPVERLALQLAGKKVREALKTKGIKIKDLPEGKFDQLVAGVLEKSPNIREVAKQQIEAANAITIDGLTL